MGYAPPGQMYGQGPTCFERMKYGFTIGFCVGLASGALFGGFTALRYGYFIFKCKPQKSFIHMLIDKEKKMKRKIYELISCLIVWKIR